MSKSVLVTGTSTGFGKLITVSLANAGYTVFATMRGTNGKNAAQAAALAALDNVEVLEPDVTDQSTIDAAVAAIIEKTGRLDIVVNNAGVYGGGITEAYSPERVETLFNVNFFGPIRVNNAALPHLRKSGDGLIVNVSSSLGRFSAPFMVPYNATKAALESYVEGQSWELKGLGVDSVIVQPGAFPTEIFGKAGIDADRADIPAQYGEIAEIPAKIGEGLGQVFQSEHAPNPQLVADAVLNLANAAKGERPLRTSVDPLTGTFVEATNEVAEENRLKFLAGFGLG